MALIDKARRDAAVDRTSLVALISRSVRLVREGREHTGLCPFHEEKTPSFTVSEGKKFYHCFGCGAHGDAVEWLMSHNGLPFREAVFALERDAGLSASNAAANPPDARRREKREREEAQEAERKRKSARGLWLSAAPLRGTPAQDYLTGRGIDFDRLGYLPGAIRFRDDVPHGKLRQKLPAMLSAIIDPEHGHIATHRTFLEWRDGCWQKLERIDEEKSRKLGRKCLHKAKLVLGEFRGGHIPLCKGATGKALKAVPAGTPGHFSEGVEDGLTVAMLDPARWVGAAVSLGNIGALNVPPQMGDFVLIGQRDAPGSGADRQLENCLAAQQRRAIEDGSNRKVMAIWPRDGFKDFNDQLTGKRMAA